MSRFEEKFAWLLLSQDLHRVFVREHRFHPVRKWRFDFADVEHKIAVEIEGGVRMNGRHNRADGYMRDAEKYNEAVKLGWRVLRYCSLEQMRNFPADYLTMLQP